MARFTLKDLAIKVLKDEEKPLSGKEIWNIAVSKGYDKYGNFIGKAPWHSIEALIYADMLRNPESPFVKIAPGKFGLKVLGKNSYTKIPYRIGSFKYAAYQVLKSANKPLNFAKITEIALKKKLLSTTGKTPEATTGAQLYSDVKNKGKRSCFVQLGKSTFGLREWDIGVLKREIEKQKREEKVFFDKKKRSIAGNPINFKGLIYEPINEKGVIFLFSKVHKTLDINIEAIQALYPDAKGRRKTKKGWEDIWIEFEYKSSHFKTHKHDPDDCDIIVCWEHDWPDCPLEVIELKKIIDDYRNK